MAVSLSPPLSLSSSKAAAQVLLKAKLKAKQEINGDDTISNQRNVFGESRPLSVLFYFVPQEKGLIWRPPWGWKNMRESILHWEDGPPWGKMHPNWCSHMPRSK